VSILRARLIGILQLGNTRDPEKQKEKKFRQMDGRDSVSHTHISHHIHTHKYMHTCPSSCRQSSSCPSLASPDQRRECCPKCQCCREPVPQIHMLCPDTTYIATYMHTPKERMLSKMPVLPRTCAADPHAMPKHYIHSYIHTCMKTRGSHNNLYKCVSIELNMYVCIHTYKYMLDACIPS
jgi:hypothetical protein